MSVKRIGMFAATAAAGALLLTACGGGDDGASGAPAAASASATSGAAGGTQPALSSLSFRTGTAQSNNAPRDTGDFANRPGKPATPAGAKWVGLSASQAGNLNPVVVNGAGFTLYRFDKDSADPSKSNCNGDCAVTWPPVIVAPHGKIFINGIEKQDIGVIKRDDGNLQVTIGGWPVYRFSKDLKPGDTNGQGVQGTWFGVTPDGQKAAGAPGGQAGGDQAGGQTGGQTGSQAGGGQNAAPGTRVVLFDDPNFADNGSQAVTGSNSCQPVPRTGVASSLQTDGQVKIWTGPDCTGTSKVVDGDIADLSTIGFDDNISSIRFS